MLGSAACTTHAQQLSSKALTTRVTAFIVLLEKRRVAIQNLVYFRTGVEPALRIYSGLAPEAQNDFSPFRGLALDERGELFRRRCGRLEIARPACGRGAPAFATIARSLC